MPDWRVGKEIVDEELEEIGVPKELCKEAIA
jgi:hypothetical protein